MLKLRKNKKGFSLVELIVVIAIMAVLAGVVGGTLFSQLNKQKDNSAESEAKTLANSIKIAIQADTNYQNATTPTALSNILDEAVSDSEGALISTGSTPKAGEHKFLAAAPDPTTGATEATITLKYTSAKSGSKTGTIIVTYKYATATTNASVTVSDVTYA